jgi:hypothetical protein
MAPNIFLSATVKKATQSNIDINFIKRAANLKKSIVIIK